MTRSKAILSGVLFPLLLAAAVWFLVLSDRRDDAGTLRAEFQTAGLLVPGDDVRVRGATAGTVRDVELTDRGTAMVSFSLEKPAPALRADASASVRDADLLGGTFLAIDPGADERRLTGPIPHRQTFLAPRVQDMFDTFSEPVRTALQTLVAELATALDQRGLELNRAVLRLAPALRAAREASAQLGSQEAQLERAIGQLQQLTGQLAPRERDAERLVDGLDRTLATTAGRARHLDRAVADLPATLRQLRASLLALDDATSAARPAVQDLGAAAPLLARAGRRLAPFAREVRTALGDVQPFVRSLRSTLRSGSRTLPRLQRAMTTLAGQAPSIAAFATMVEPYASYLVQGVFAGIGGLAAEPGTQAFSHQPGRNYFRGEAVLGCETFGIPTAPGCLTKLVGSMAGAVERRRTAPKPRRQQPSPAAKAPLPAVKAPLPAVKPPVLPRVDEPGQLQQGVQRLLDFLLAP